MTIHSASRERLATDLSREGCTLVLLNGFQQIFGFLEEGPSQLDAVDREAAYSINLPSSIDSFVFVSRGETIQDEP